MGRLQVFLDGGRQLIAFVVVAVLVWGLGTCVFLYFWPPITYSAYKRAIVQHGLGGPIPVNTLYAMPTLSSPAASNSSLLATGTNDVLYIGGLLDLSKGPHVLHVPSPHTRTATTMNVMSPLPPREKYL